MIVRHSEESPVFDETTQCDIAPSILVADDDPVNLIVFQKMIEGNVKPYHAILTNEPGRVLDLALEFLPKAILLDFQMPGQDGVELCNLIKSNNELKMIPVILITGTLLTDELKERGLKAGAYDFLVKPIDIRLFAETMQQVLSPGN